MSEIDRYFDQLAIAIAEDSKFTASRAARELQEDVYRQIRRNFRNPSAAFMRGIKVEEYETAAYVRLSPILSVHAEPSKLEGSPNLWILLPDGARNGFKRLSKSFTWDFIKRRYGTRLSFVPHGDGHVVLYRSPNGVVRIYKIQPSVTTRQRIEFYEKAEEIAEREGFDFQRDGRSVGFKNS
jgi:hypothetical protein